MKYIKSKINILILCSILFFACGGENKRIKNLYEDLEGSWEIVSYEYINQEDDTTIVLSDSIGTINFGLCSDISSDCDGFREIPGLFPFRILFFLISHSKDENLISLRFSIGSNFSREDMKLYDWTGTYDIEVGDSNLRIFNSSVNNLVSTEIRAIRAN